MDITDKWGISGWFKQRGLKVTGVTWIPETEEVEIRVTAKPEVFKEALVGGVPGGYLNYELLPEHGIYTLEITFQCEDYVGTTRVQVGSNEPGAGVLACVLDDLEHGDYQWYIDDPIVLTNPKGQTMELDYPDPSYIVGIRIVKVESGADGGDDK